MKKVEQRSKKIYNSVYKNITNFNLRLYEQLRRVEKYDIKNPNREKGNWFKYDYVKNTWFVKIGYHPVEYKGVKEVTFTKREDVIDFLKSAILNPEIEREIVRKTIVGITKNKDTTIGAVSDWCNSNPSGKDHFKSIIRGFKQ